MGATIGIGGGARLHPPGAATLRRDSNRAEDHLMLEQLREIRAEQDATREHGHEIMARLSGMA